MTDRADDFSDIDAILAEEREAAAEPPEDEDIALARKGQVFAEHYLVNAATLLATAKLEPDWLVKDAVVAGGVTFIVGPPGGKKSWLAYDLACAVVQQRSWLGFDTPQAFSGTPGVMILNFDNPGSECARRFLRLGLQPTDHAMFHSLGAHRPPEGLPTILQLPLAFEPLHAMVAAFRPDLIVIDSLRQAHLGDESSSQEMAVVMSQARQLAGMGAAVCIIHHTRKNDGAMRGSTEIEAAADAIIDVSENTITWRKTRGWEMQDATRTFKLEDEDEMTYLRGGPTLAMIIELNGPQKLKDLAKLLDVKPATCKIIVDRAKERGLIKDGRDGGNNAVLELCKPPTEDK
jgi:RecA-family ATPase